MIEYWEAAKIAAVGIGMVFMVLIVVGIVVRLTSIVVEKIEEKNS